MPNSRTPQELIVEIERKDRRFRLSQTIFVCLLIVGLLVVIAYQFQILNQVKQQLEYDQQATMETRKQRDEQLERIERRLTCIVQFFTNEDRETLSVEDIDHCTLQTSQDGSVGFFDETPTRGNNVSSQQSAPTPTQPTPTNPTPTTPTPTQPTVTPPESRPVEVLGLPLCVPILNLCVEQ